MIGPLVAITAVVWGTVGVVAAFRARRRAEQHHYNAMMWRSTALATAQEWVRREKGEVAAKDFITWANDRSDTMLRDHLPAIAKTHSARWPNNSGGAA